MLLLPDKEEATEVASVEAEAAVEVAEASVEEAEEEVSEETPWTELKNLVPSFPTPTLS